MKKEYANHPWKTMVNVVIGIVSNSFTAAGSTMVGQNLGAKQYERVPKILKTVGFCTILISSVFAICIVCFQDFAYQWYGDALAGFILIVIGMCYYLSWRRKYFST